MAYGHDKPSLNATNSNVASSASNVLLLASNENRYAGVIYNDSTAILYVLLNNTGASLVNYTVQVPSQGTYILPDGYCGEVDGIWASANGFARVTELT